MRVRLWTFWLVCILFILSEKIIMAQSLPFDGQWLQEGNLVTTQNLNIPYEEGVSQKKWKLDVGAGIFTGPYVKQLEKVLKAANLQGCRITFFGDQVCYPQKNPGLAFMASISRDVSKSVALGVTFKRSFFLGVEGTRGKRFSSDSYSVAPMVTVQIPKTWWFIGAGPAYHNLNIKFSEHSLLIKKVNHKKIGFLIDAGIVGPMRGAVFGKLSFSYLYLGEISTEKYEFTDFVSGVNVKTTIPSTGITFNQLIFSLGLGFRL